MTTLFDATYRLAGFLSVMRRGTATGGSVTTLVDSLATFTDDQVDGTIFGLTGTLANIAIPITVKTSTTTLTFATQTPKLFAAGNRYAVSNSDFNRETLRWAINQALRVMEMRRTENATLTTVSDQEDYTLPTGVSDVKEVWIAQSTSTPYNYMQLFHWDEVGTNLHFPVGFAPGEDGYKLLLVYRGAFVEYATDSGSLPLDVNEDLLHWQAAVNAVHDGNMRFANDAKRDLANKMTEAQAMLQSHRRNWHEWKRSTRPADY